jgi:hypothetical protein
MGSSMAYPSQIFDPDDSCNPLKTTIFTIKQPTNPYLMKRSFIYALTAIVLVAMVISCSKDDPAAAPSVVGTWKFATYLASGCTEPLDNETGSCSGTLIECGALVITATTYDNTPGTLSGGSAESGTFVISGASATVTPTGGSATVYNFTVTATTLTLSRVDDSSGCTETSTFTRQ